jgi:hypothetical protein
MRPVPVGVLLFLTPEVSEMLFVCLKEAVKGLSDLSCERSQNNPVE